MREICYKCLRSKANCFCRFLRPFDPGVKFVLLMHPKEAKRQRTGTGRLAAAGLVGAEILVGIDFSGNARLCELLSDPQFFPVLLYPGEDAIGAKSPELAERLGGRKLLAIIIDSTWFCSKKMLKSANLANLPRLTFSGSYRSLYTFKREPSPECVSTIETCYHLVNELREAGVASADGDAESLMTAFKEMVRFQLEKENDRVSGRIPDSHSTDRKYQRLKSIPDYLKPDSE